jgi:FAD/FMN-containing dehydrogenase
MTTMRRPHESLLAEDLRTAVRGRVRFDTASRAMWSADASNYRHVPLGVVQPVDLDDVEAAVDVARRHAVPVLPRGASTSIGGMAVNEALVLDFSRHLTRAPRGCSPVSCSTTCARPPVPTA